MSRILSNRLRNLDQNRRPTEVEPEMIKLQRYFQGISGELIRRREARGLSIKQISFRFAEQMGLTIGSSIYNSSAYRRMSNLENGHTFQNCYSIFGKKLQTKKIETLSRDLTAYLELIDTPEGEAIEFIQKISEKIKGLEYLAKK